jgi:hypothetical protein
MLGALFGAIRRLPEQIHQPVLRDRFLDEEERARPSGFDGAIPRAFAADHDGLRLWIDIFQMLEELNAVNVGKGQARKNHIRTPMPVDLFPRFASKGGADLIAFGFNDVAEPIDARRLLVNGKYAPAALSVQ